MLTTTPALSTLSLHDALPISQYSVHHLQCCIVRIFPESADMSHHHHTLIHIPFVHQINRAIKVIINFRQINNGLAAFRNHTKSLCQFCGHIFICTVHDDDHVHVLC